MAERQRVASTVSNCIAKFVDRRASCSRLKRRLSIQKSLPAH
jgi:hypothetical protein